MKFTVSSTTLFKHLQDISRVIGTKNSIPILDCFLFELKGNTLTLTASDAEITMTTSLELVSSEEDGRFAINAKTMLDAIRMIPEQPMTFDVNMQSMDIVANYQNGHYSVIGQRADEYPQPQDLEKDAQKLTIDASQLSEGLERATFAAADDPLRPVMNGVYFDIATDCLTMVASNGKTLVTDKFATSEHESATSFILPSKPSALLRNVLPHVEGKVEITFTKRNTFFEMDGYTLMGRLIEGRYPNYNSVIPSDNPNKVTVDRASFINALKRIVVFAPKSTGVIKVSLNDNNIVIVASDPEFGTYAEENIPCEYEGTPMSIGFPGSSLLEVLNNLTGENAIIELADPSRPALFMPTEQPKDENILMLLMPMMLNE